LTLAHPGDHVFALGDFIVLVQRLEATTARDAVRTEEHARVPGVLAVDHIGASKELQCSWRQIAQIPERRRDQHQLSFGPGLVHVHPRLAREALRPLTLSPMSKRTNKRKLRAKKKANHGKRPNCGRG